MAIDQAEYSEDLVDIPGSGSSPLKVVAFTAGPLAPVNRAFFERLARDPLLNLHAIIVDEYQRPRKPLVMRLLRGLREEGWPWLWFKVTTGLKALIQRTALSLFERTHRRMGLDESYETFARETGVSVYRVPDIHQEESLMLIKSLQPQLGVIVGGRILRDAVVTIPEYGTLNIHKRKVPEYRGGGPMGYWEVLAGENAIGVTIHYAISQVDAGDILGQATIPIEECDTLESLRIKADILGAQLYHDTIRRVALGFRKGVPQDTSRGKTYRAPSEFKVWQFERRLRRKATRTIPLLRMQASWAVRTRLFVQYVVLLPWLLGLRRRLVKRRRAPIAIFFYHVVANRPVNHMCLPLEVFVRQMEFLRRYYAIIPLDEAVERLRFGQNDEIAVAITLDDGYKANAWAIEYLRYLGIPATFFVSIDHVRDGSSFQHDLRRGFMDAAPLSITELQQLASQGFTIGSHRHYHEDFGAIGGEAADRVLRESRRLIAEVTGQTPAHFSFPKGQRATNITTESFALALKHYPYVYSAYGGYNIPCPERRHFLRMGNPVSVLALAMVMDGYTGLRQCLAGNAWGLKTDALSPY
jgi:folate-dependent phosphoribosylglycinamide formyltransferase PurN/peptidoglycan/xylan/chitin deacetylase (PgdA/CDA1 family)